MGSTSSGGWEGRGIDAYIQTLSKRGTNDLIADFRRSDGNRRSQIIIQEIKGSILINPQ